MPDPLGGGPILLYRAFVPRWAHDPLSGEGAARFGGRWNPVGAATIYAARELSTAWAEYNQGFVQHPALVVTMQLADANLADLTDPGELAALGLDVSIHQIEWRDLVARGKPPPSYALRERLLHEGRHGVVYPSFMSPGGTCVALWRWNERTGPALTVIDPEGRLPRNPASWL
jgi:RES domain-containing protein